MAQLEAGEACTEDHDMRHADDHNGADWHWMCHNSAMAHKRFTVHMGERGRLVIPAKIRRRMGVKRGDLLALDLDERGEVLELRTARDVARSARGLLRGLAPGADLTRELIEDRRQEAEREATDDGHAAKR